MDISKEITFDDRALQCLIDYSAYKGKGKLKGVRKRITEHMIILICSLISLAVGDYWLAIVYSLLNLLILWYTQMYYPKMFRKANADNLGKTTVFRFTDDTIENASPDHVFIWKWNAVKKYEEYEGFFMIFVSSNRIVLLDKTQYTEDEMEQIREKLRSVIPSSIPKQSGT